MLPRFPEPYPDETLYSILCRLRKTLFFKRRRAFEATFAARRDLHFALKTSRLHGHVPAEWFSVERALQHTILPFYRAFVEEQTYADWLEAFRSGKPKLSLRMGKCGRPVLKACPICVAEDRELGREPYFRVSHQILGNFACGRHSVLLATFELDPDCIPFKVLADQVGSFNWKTRPCHRVWSLLAQDLDDAPFFPEISLSGFWPKFLNILKMRGVGNHWKHLALDYLRFSSKEILNTFDDGLEWFLVRGSSRGVLQPAQCLFLIRAIGLTPREFLEFRCLPIEEDRWPCSNRTCTLYGQDVMVPERVIDLSRAHDSRKYCKGVILACPQCGLRLIQEGFRKMKRCVNAAHILDFGRDWNEKFKALWPNASVSFRSLCEGLGVPRHSLAVYHAAYLNNLPLDRGGLPISMDTLARYQALNFRRLRKFKLAGGTLLKSRPLT